MLCLVGGQDGFRKLRSFNRNLKEEIDNDPNHEKYFTDYLELKRLQREGKSF